MPVPTPQITIFLDASGTVHAEAPGGSNGSRKKIDLPFDFAIQNPELMAELQLQDAENRRRERARLMELQGQNVQYVSNKFGPILARQVWHNGKLAFSASLKRKLAQTALDKTEAKSTKKSKQKTQNPTTEKPINIFAPIEDFQK